MRADSMTYALLNSSTLCSGPRLRQYISYLAGALPRRLSVYSRALLKYFADPVSNGSMTFGFLVFQAVWVLLDDKEFYVFVVFLSIASQWASAACSKIRVVDTTVRLLMTLAAE